MNFVILDRDTFVSNPLRFDVYALVLTCNGRDVFNVISVYTGASEENKNYLMQLLLYYGVESNARK